MRLVSEQGETLMDYTMITTNLLVNSFTNFFLFIHTLISYALMVPKEVPMDIKMIRTRHIFIKLSRYFSKVIFINGSHLYWTELCPLKNSYVKAPIPLDVTVFGSKTFQEVIKVKWGNKGAALIQ